MNPTTDEALDVSKKQTLSLSLEGYTVVCSRFAGETFLITAAQINQSRNEGLKGSHKSFTTFSLSLGCAKISGLSGCLLFQLVHERPLCEMKSVRRVGFRVPRRYFIVGRFLFSAHSHMKRINQFSLPF